MAGEHRPLYAEGVEQGNHVGGEVLHAIARDGLVGVAVPSWETATVRIDSGSSSRTGS